MCGEKDFKSAHPSQQLGSPPRMRGKVLSYRAAPEYPGITPAYAGKSVRVSFGSIRGGDHPRVCGEKMDDIGHVGIDPGSPPRMRGKD